LQGSSAGGAEFLIHLSESKAPADGKRLVGVAPLPQSEAVIMHLVQKKFGSLLKMGGPLLEVTLFCA
jgi:hypothetical protein